MDIEKKRVTDNKYDRQLRLWGANGQDKLMNSHICLFGCNPCGVEAVKNLVLPGIKNITLVDDQTVTDRDLGNNFFVTLQDIGTNRSQAILKNLLEMNPDDVKGTAILDSPSSRASNINFLKQFNIIISNEMTDSVNIQLSQHCFNLNIQLIILNTYGLIGRLRIQANFHSIIESKPEADIYDLRINAPFTQLIQYCNNIDIFALQVALEQNKNLEKQQQKKSEDASSQQEETEDFIYAHIPFIVLLVKALEFWRKNHQKDPKTFEEKKQFKEILKQWSLFAKAEDRENFEQAQNKSFLVFKDPLVLPDNIQSLLECKQLENVSEESDSFLIFCKALKNFVQEHKGLLPLSPKIPDMKATTQGYLNLKNVYQQKYLEDLADFKKSVAQISKKQYQEEEYKLFIENILVLEYVDYKPYFLELTQPNEIENFENDTFKWLIGVKSINQYYEQFGKYPGQGDVQQLQTILEGIREKQFSNFPIIEEDIVKELCRYEGSHLHTISSIIGGIASQEAVKLITHQFIPLNNTLIYNGIKCVAEVYQL